MWIKGVIGRILYRISRNIWKDLGDSLGVMDRVYTKTDFQKNLIFKF